MSKQRKDNNPSPQGTRRKNLSEKEKPVEKHQDDGDAADYQTPTKPARVIDTGKYRTVVKKLEFSDDDSSQISCDAVSSDSDEELPDPKEKLKNTVANSKKYPTTCQNYLEGKQKINFGTIYRDLPRYVAEVKVKSSVREELSKLLKDMKMEPRNLGRHTMDILEDKTETRDKPNHGPKKSVRDEGLRAYSLEEPEVPVEKNCYFLSCEYIMTIHLPEDSISWFVYYNKRSKLITNIKKGKENERWIFIPSFRRAKIALLDWPKDTKKTGKKNLRLLVVRPSQFDEYVRYCGHQVPVICLPHDEIGAGYPRFWIQKIAFWLKLSFIWMLDDSIIWFEKFHPTEKKDKKRGPRMGFGDVFSQIEETLNKFVEKFPNDLIAAMSPRRFSPYLHNVKKNYVCKPPQCAVYLNIDALSSKRIHYRPELPQFEDMMFAYECDKNGLKVYVDNTIVVMDCHMWKDSGASSRSVRPGAPGIMRGLTNYNRTTCWLNAILQCLASSPFRNSCQNLSLEDVNRMAPWQQELCSTIAALRVGNFEPINNKSVAKLLAKELKLSLEIQQDAHECLVEVVELYRKTSSGKLDFMKGEFEVIKICKSCGKGRERKKEAFSCYPIHLPELNESEHISLSDMIDKAMKDTLKAYCDSAKCRKETTHSVERKMTGLPTVLVLSVGRFGWQQGSPVKMKRAVKPKRVLKCSITNTGRPGKFCLKSLVVHVGDSVQYGHYIAFVLEDNILYKCDDEEVSVCPMDQLDSSLVQENVYLLFYQLETGGGEGTAETCMGKDSDRAKRNSSKGSSTT